MFFLAGSMTVPDVLQHIFQVDVVLRMSSEPLPRDGRWTRDGSPRCQAGVDECPASLLPPKVLMSREDASLHARSSSDAQFDHLSWHDRWSQGHDSSKSLL